MASNPKRLRRLREGDVFNAIRRLQDRSGISLTPITHSLAFKLGRPMDEEMVMPILENMMKRGIVKKMHDRYKLVETTAAFRRHDRRRRQREDIEPVSAPESTSGADIGNKNGSHDEEISEDIEPVSAPESTSGADIGNKNGSLDEEISEDIEPMSAPESTSEANIGSENGSHDEEISDGEESFELQDPLVKRLCSELGIANKWKKPKPE